MCGFMGVFNRGASKLNWQSAEELLRHRGPDDRGYFEDPQGRVEVLFRRLSIIDLDSGHQPLFNADKSVMVVMNGEIYNYRELRKDLIEQGAVFHTESDTEVLVHLYERKGTALVHDLEGMFAFLIWDAKKGVLHAFRDRFGIKPLYICQSADHIALASEVKPLLRLPFAKREISPIGLSQYLSFGYSLGRNTIFKNIFRVPQATHVEISRSGTRENTYWDIAPKPDSDITEQSILKEFDRSIELHLRSDVKVGAFLSGGFDSGMVVARAAPQMGEALSTYTIRFKDSEFDESPYAEEISRRYGTHHHTLDVTGDDFVDLLPHISWAFDEPIADSGVFPNFVISRFASKDGCKVVLAGTGGDELFAGYTHHVRNSLENRFKGFELPLRGLGMLLGGEFGRKLYRTGSYDADPEAHYFGHAAVFARPEMFLGRSQGKEEKSQWMKRFPGDRETARLYADLHTYLPDNLMLLFDRATMAWGVEGRVPFLHHPLVESALSIPPAMRTPGNQRKGLLKNLARPYLPESLYSLPKQGFNSPIRAWMQGSLGKTMWGVLSSKSMRKREWWVEGALTPARLRSFHFHQLWTLFQLELFCRVHLDRDLRNASDIQTEELMSS